MKKLFTTVALCLSAITASAFTPANIASECARQMTSGICTVRPDRSTLQPGDKMVIPGVGAVSYGAYHDYMDLFNEANPQDTAMCALALDKMTTAPGGDHDLIARALWTPNEYEDMETFLARKNAESISFESLLASFAVILFLVSIFAYVNQYIFKNANLRH